MPAASAENYGVILSTVSTRDDAKTIAEALLSARLAACVQFLPSESYYSWKGRTANDAELLLLVKTRTALFGDVIEAIRRHHPYETPEIAALPFAAGFAGYFAWIDEVTKRDQK